MRVYIASSVSGLAALNRSGELAAAPMTAHAVTPALRASHGDADTEELEYEAMMAAAADSLQLLSLAGEEVRRRVVIAAEVAENAVRPAPDDVPSRVTVAATIPMTRIASVHIDDPAASRDVADAADAVTAGRGVDDEAALARLEDHELMWFATQELPDLLIE